MEVVSSCCGEVSQGQGLNDWSGLRRKLNGAKNRDSLNDIAKTLQAWLRVNSVNVLEWPTQSPDCSPTVPIKSDRA